jgi:hypothetical protein
MKPLVAPLKDGAPSTNTLRVRAFFKKTYVLFVVSALRAT